MRPEGCAALLMMLMSAVVSLFVIGYIAAQVISRDPHIGPLVFGF